MQGRCLCGSVRYRLCGQPYHVTHCHCASCRKASGAPFVTWLTVRRMEVQWQGEALQIYRSSLGVERGFCARCGTTLSYCHEAAPEEIDLTVATLDNPDCLRPEDHTWTEQRVSWVTDMAGLPSHRRYRSVG